VNQSIVASLRHRGAKALKAFIDFSILGTAKTSTIDFIKPRSKWSFRFSVSRKQFYQLKIIAN
jgi:hypothetical protein